MSGLMSGSATANEWDWDWKDSVHTGLVVADFLQTKEILRNDNFYERNPILRNKNIDQVALLMGTSAILGYILPRIVPVRHKNSIHAALIVSRSVFVINNIRIGVKIKF